MILREARTRWATAAHKREFGLFAGSTLLYQGGRFLFSLAAARTLSPADFSTWALALSVLVYAPSLLLGVTNGMSRELPIISGRGDDRASRRVESAAWLATGVVTTIVCVVSAFAAAGSAVSLALVGLLSAGSIVYFTTLSVHRSRLRFNAASAQQAAFGVAILCLSSVLIWTGTSELNLVLGAYGACLLVSIAIGVTIARPQVPVWDGAGLRKLAGIGFPIMLAGLLFSIYVTLDRWVAIALVGREDAAPYALASLVAAAALVIPSVVSQQIYPRMGIAKGAGRSGSVLQRMARDQGVLAFTLVLPFVVAIVLFAWFGVPVFLPEYEEAATLVVILSLGLLALSLMSGYGNYLNVIGGQWRYLAVQVIGLIAALALTTSGGIWLGPLGVAAGMSLSHVLYGLALRATALRTHVRPTHATNMPSGMT